MIERFKCTPEDFEDYLNEQNQGFDQTMVWTNLQGKGEYGLKKSERTYQNVVAEKAFAMAKELGLNAERASFYAKCLGAAFPAYGQEGLKCIEEYAKAHDMPFEEKEILASVIEEALDWSGGFVFEGLRPILLELFDLAKDSEIPEVELAKLYHEQMEILKILDGTFKKDYARSEKALDEKIEANIREGGIACCKKWMTEQKESLDSWRPCMGKEEKENYFKTLDGYREYAGEECFVKFILHEENPC